MASSSRLDRLIRPYIRCGASECCWRQINGFLGFQRSTCTTTHTKHAHVHVGTLVYMLKETSWIKMQRLALNNHASGLRRELLHDVQEPPSWGHKGLSNRTASARLTKPHAYSRYGTRSNQKIHHDPSVSCTYFHKGYQTVFHGSKS